MTDNDVINLLKISSMMDGVIVDATPYLWHYYVGDVVYWNTDNNEEDLANSDGDTYSYELYGTPVETKNYIIFENCYDGCGGRVTIVFDKRKEFDVDTYWWYRDLPEEDDL